MTNPNLADYWSGYRAAKLAVYLYGIEAADALKYDDEDSQFAFGFAAGISKLSNELIDMIRREEIENER